MPDCSLKGVALGGGFGRSACLIVKEGKPFGDLIGLVWVKDSKGNRIVDALGKPVASTGQEYIGNVNPKATLGFTNTFKYKSSYLRVIVDGRVGGTLVSGTEMNLVFSGVTELTEKFR